MLGAHRGALKAVVGRFVEGTEGWGCLVLGASSPVLSHLMKSARRGGLGFSRVLGVMQALQMSDEKKNQKNHKKCSRNAEPEALLVQQQVGSLVGLGAEQD